MAFRSTGLTNAAEDLVKSRRNNPLFRTEIQGEMATFKYGKSRYRPGPDLKGELTARVESRRTVISSRNCPVGGQFSTYYKQIKLFVGAILLAWKFKLSTFFYL